MQEPASGSIASFGAYMLVISFSVLPVKNPLQQVLIAAGIMIFFATLGFSAPGGSIYFFLFAILAALAQGLAELRGGNLRLPVSLAALVFFLAHGQSSAETLSQYIFSFGLGCLWAIPFILIFIPKETLSPARAPLYPMESPTQRRFLLGITFTALLGTIAVSLSTVAHACWIPAAALRVVKPGWEETRYRIQTRSMGTMLGAIVGSIILVCYPLPLVSHSHCWRDVPVNVTVWGQKLLPLVILSDHNYPGLQSSRRQRYFFISSGTSTFHYRRNFDRVHYDEDIFVQAILASWFEPDDRSCQLSAISRLSLQ
ncbi:hypothetical protein LNN85_07220 [Klebsiella pneumoniae subsp. pneumoniae]|nr:hypothetical protein [Klebsiella pneumoniae subsp. pneumoniae]